MRVLYLQYTNPAAYPPLQHSSRILADKGWKVLFLGTSAHGADALEFPLHPNIHLKRLPFCPAGWRQKLHYVQFAFWAFLWVLLWRPGWIYLSDPLACPIGLLLSLVPGLKMLYHEHDSPNLKREGSVSRFESVVLTTRRKVAQRASLSILPNEGRAERFKQETGAHRPIIRVWNCPALEEARQNGLQRDSQKFVIFFHGSLVPWRIPTTVLEALTKLPDRVVLHVAGYETIGHAGYLQALKDQATLLGVHNRFMVLGPLPRYSLLDHCRGAGVGLAFMALRSDDVNEQLMAGASNKPFDYLACGLALLVSDLPDWKELFVEPGYGLACDPQDPESIARQLRWFVEHPVETRSMGAKGHQRILSEWNYEKQFSSVLHHLNRSVQA